MRNVLHILTRADDKLATEIISLQRQQADTAVEVIDISVQEPDYKGLAREIFEADSVQVW